MVRDVPRRFISGSSVLTAAFMASPAITSSGRKALPQLNSLPTWFTPTTKPWLIASSGSIPLLDRLPGQLFRDFSIAINDALSHGFEQLCSHIDLLS